MFAKSRVPFVTAICLVSLFLIMGLTTPAFANDRLKIQTHIDTTYKYESNYFKAESNEEEVDGILITPGLSMGYTTGKTDVSLDYDLKGHVFIDEPTGVDDYAEHVGVFGFKSDITDRITIKLDESLMYTRDPASSDVNSNAVTRNKYYLNRVTPALFYNFNDKLVSGLKYQRTDTDYRDQAAGAEDSQEDKGEFNVYYNLNSESRISFDYQYWNREFDLTSSDYTSNQGRIGFALAQQKITLMVNAGLQSREFDTGGLDDVDEFIWNLTIAAQNPPYPEAKPRSHAKLSFDHNLNNTGTTYLATRVSAEAGYIFMDKIDFILGGYYQNSEYEFSDRDDKTWNGSVKVDYLINDMWVTGIEYGYETRDSNVSGKDYDNNYVLFHVDLLLDFGSK